MAHISKDIKELLDRDNPKTRKWTRKLLYFLALVGLIAVIAGAVQSCPYQEGTPPAEMEAQ